MKSTDLNKQREEIRAKMMESFREENSEKFSEAFNEMCECVGESVRAEYDEKINGLREELDNRVLASRGVRQLTSEEKEYYTELMQAMKSGDPKQAIANIDKTLPKTVVNSVFEELQTKHPLLSKIDFFGTDGAVELLMNTSGNPRAVWGDLCAEIVTEITAGFKSVNMTLCKLSAFLPVCKAMLDLGPEWLDNYVRQILYEAIANGLEYGIVVGNGKNSPIGMNRQVGDGVTVTDGVYPEKATIEVNGFDPATIGNLISNMAVSADGKPRDVEGVILLVNPQDYFQKVMPATTVMAPDGTYRNDVMPYPMEIIKTSALTRGKAIIGIAFRYFMGVGTSKEGRIEFSDHAQFLADKRVYLIKLYGNGLAKDNNSFLYLDISGLSPKSYKVEVVDSREPSSDANLSSLRIGNLTLSPAFNAATTTYTAATTNASNVVSAIPAEAAATVKVKVGSKEIDNGTSATWESGSNTVSIEVTAADGTTTKTYTITVTKS